MPSRNASLDRAWSTFSLAFFGVAMTLQLIWLAVTPIVCSGGPHVRMPWASTAAVVASSERDLTVTIRADGSCFVGSTLVPMFRLAEELTAIQSRTSRSLVIKADGALRLSAIHTVLRAARDAGFTSAELITFEGNALEGESRRGAAL